jgi:hypothetical protein
MIEIKCPRCEQYWYDDDDAEGGRVRLCSRCVDQLRLERGHRAEIDIPFLIGVGVFLVFDLIMIALTAMMPAVFGKATLILGLIMSVIGGRLSLRFLRSGEGWHIADQLSSPEWKIGRWAFLVFLSGLALTGFALPRVLR